METPTTPASHPFFQRLYDKLFCEALDHGCSPSEAEAAAQDVFDQLVTPPAPESITIAGPVEDDGPVPLFDY